MPGYVESGMSATSDGGKKKGSKKQMADDAQTKPTIETILERMQAMEGRLTQSFDILLNKEAESARAHLKERFDELETHLVRIDGMVHRTRGEMLEIRADLNEFRKEFNEFRAQFKQPA